MSKLLQVSALIGSFLSAAACGGGGDSDGTILDAATSRDAPSGGGRSCEGVEPRPEATLDAERSGCQNAPLTYTRSRICLNDELVVCDATAVQAPCGIECVPGTGWLPAMDYELLSGSATRMEVTDDLTVAFALQVHVVNRGAAPAGGLMAVQLLDYLEFRLDGVAATGFTPGSADAETIGGTTEADLDFNFSGAVDPSSPLATAASVTAVLRERPTELVDYGVAVEVPIAEGSTAR